MEKNGTTKNYKFGTKNNWRRAVWNEIDKRLRETGRRPKDAIVLYLAGEQDLDRKVMLEHGFRPDNLLIIERDKDVAKKLRKEGKIVICADIRNALLAWGDNHPRVQILYADYCCGLEPKTLIIEKALIGKPSFNTSIAMINFLRGRDASSNDLRAAMGRWSRSWLGAGEELDKKHRGEQYVFSNAMKNFTLIKLGANPAFKTSPHYDENYFLGPKNQDEFFDFLEIYGAYKRKLFSYKSGHLTMDSVVFQSPGVGHVVWPDRPEIKKARRQIAAALAIRTMKLSGKLRHSPAA